MATHNTHALSLAMGTHPRLGAASPLLNLAPELLRSIWKWVRDARRLEIVYCGVHHVVDWEAREFVLLKPKKFTFKVAITDSFGAHVTPEGEPDVGLVCSDGYELKPDKYGRGLDDAFELKDRFMDKHDNVVFTLRLHGHILSSKLRRNHPDGDSGAGGSRNRKHKRPDSDSGAGGSRNRKRKRPDSDSGAGGKPKFILTATHVSPDGERVHIQAEDAIRIMTKKPVPPKPA